MARNKKSVIKKKGPNSAINAISILLYAISATLALSGLMLFLPGLIRFLMGGEETTIYLTISLAGLPFLLISIVFFMLGKGIWEGQNWARITTLLVFFMSIVSSLLTVSGFSIFNKSSYIALIEVLSSIKLIISILVFSYLGFSKESEKHFS